MRRNIGARLALLLIPLGALLSMVLYAWSTGFISVSCDEFSKTVIASRGLSHPSEWFGGIWMPLHFVLIAGTSLVTGDLLLAARLVSLAFGALLILALFGIGRHFGGNLGGALAATVGRPSARRLAFRDRDGRHLLCRHADDGAEIPLESPSFLPSQFDRSFRGVRIVDACMCVPL